MKRYLLFAYDLYYPCGGFHDFIKDFDSLDEALREIAVIAVHRHYDGSHIVDSTTREVVWQS